MTIAEFLLARIAEDEASADRVEFRPYLGEGLPELLAERVLAECEAKRRIVDLHLGTHGCVGAGPGGWDGVADEYAPCPTLLTLASVYADRPDFDPAWSI